MFNAIKYQVESDTYFRLEVVETIVSSQVGHPDTLETSLTHGDSSTLEDEKV